MKWRSGEVVKWPSQHLTLVKTNAICSIDRIHQLALTRLVGLVVVFALSLGHWATGPLPEVCAAGLPSLFRGVVVADSPQGVAVVSIEDYSQAFLAGLRPEDVVVQVDGRPVSTIDEFAALSQQMKGQAVRTNLVVLRNGQPRALELHLYSYPLLKTWNLAFIPDDEIRFVEPSAALDYWSRMGRGFESANQLDHALEAWLNALHNEPTNVGVAVHICELLAQLARQSLAVHQLAQAVKALQREIIMLQRLFDYSLTDDQLQSVKRQLQETVTTLKSVRQGSLEK